MRELLAHRNFRRLFAGQAASTLGDRIVFVALAIYVTQIGSPTDVGLVLAAHAFPLVGFLLFGGVLADRLPRHRVMIVTDLVRAALHALLAVLILTGAVAIWHIVAIEALFGTAEAFFRPAYTGLVPQTVPEALIQPAKAASSTLETLAEFAGPALATALVLGLGAGWAFAVDAATFVVSAIFLAGVRPRARGEAPVRRTVLAELREGFAEVRSRAWVWVTIAVFAVAVLFTFAPYTTLGPTVAREQYGSLGIYGVLAAVMGAGTIFGAVAGFRLRPRYPMRSGFLWVLLWPASILGFALGLPLALVVGLFALAGFGMALFGIWWETALAQRVPPHLLSRVSAYDWMGSLALLPFGYLLAGPIGQAVGGQEVVAAGAAIGLVAIATGLLARDIRYVKSATPSSGVEARA
jgi:MFS family permease